MKILDKIVGGVWMMHPMTANSWLPVVAQILATGTWAAEREEVKPYAYNSIRAGKYTEFDQAPSGSVAVYPITGVITKEDQYSGGMGMMSLMAAMRKAEAADNIVGHFMEIDCGGGEASIIETVARMVREELTKPVVAWYNNMACSAAYYIAAAADELYASEETDIAGSIGVMASFRDYTAYFESMGIKVHEIYSKLSTSKNADMKAAREGDYEPYQEKILDPYADRFITTMKEFRPDMKAPKAFAGDIYMAEEAKSIGMIDGIMKREAAMGRVIQLHNQNLEMKKIEAVLGYTLEQKDGGVFLQAHELAKIDARLVTGSDEVVEKTALQGLQDGLGNITGSLESIATRLTALETTTTAQATELETLKAAPGASQTQTQAKEDLLVEGEFKDALAEFNAKMETAASAGGMRVTK